MIIYLYYILTFVISNIIMAYCLFIDIKYRKISNSFFISLNLIVIPVIMIDLFLHSYLIPFFLIVKLLILGLTFLITLILYNLRMIGGADSKLIIFLFLMIPVRLFSFSLIFKYIIWFFLCQLIYIAKNFFYNTFFRNKRSFSQYFITNNIFSKFKRMYFSSFYKFSNYSELDSKNNLKLIIINPNLYFNFKNNKFQILTQSRPSLTFLIIIIYYFLLIF